MTLLLFYAIICTFLRKGFLKMFGDKIILCCKECTLDQKRRFFVPKSTGVEPNDELVFAINNDGNLIVYNMTFLEKLIKSYEERIKASENMNFINAMRKEMARVYTSCLGSSKVDKQGRVIIPQEACEMFKIEGSIIVQGFGKCMLIFSSREMKDKYVLSLKSK